MKVKTKRAPRLKLSAADRAELKRLKQQKLTARVWRRILTLEHLDAGLTVRADAEAVGGYHREVKRGADRYNEAGLQAAQRRSAPRAAAQAGQRRGSRDRSARLRPATGGACGFQKFWPNRFRKF